VKFKPMLAADLAKVNNDLTTLRYPKLGSPKLDGLRCVIWEGVAYSRNAEPLPNGYLQDWVRANGLHNLDGELIVGSPVETGEGTVLGRTMSGIKRRDGTPDFTFHLFDSPERLAPEFEANFTFLSEEFAGCDRIEIVPHLNVADALEAENVERYFIEQGYEGIMLRDPTAPYKNGRSSLRQEWLVKLKRFIDGEAVITGYEEAEENTNEATRDVLGRTKRSSAKAGKIGKGMIGTILAKDKKWGPMRLSPGIMSHAERKAHFENGGRSLIGAVCHWRCFGYGIKDRPRYARFYGLM